ncbi:MAG: DNA topoisomerase 3 [Oscillospiraceae bacterium]|nr:DNA topoisomerase 3 [Oscillospiraceae bacterium]
MYLNKLVIAEKPSVGKAVSAVLGACGREDGYFIGNGYIVTWCFGHLAELASADAYNEKYAKWRQEDLPIVPKPWRYTVSQGKQKQFNLLRKLMCSEDVSEVINACDAGREGELIFRTVYTLAGCTKPMKRLWISSMEDGAIREGFANLRSGQEYDALYEAAKCRARADWLVGINATRLFSVLYHRTLNVGRVVSPTLALIVQREAEINAFVPQPFYMVVVQSGELLASSERLKTEAEAKTVAAACQGQAATVTSMERKEKTEKPPALFDLTALQRSANRLLGYTAQQTLDYVQALYEKKLVTYPRTDSRFLTDDMLDKVPKIAAIASKIADIPLGEINAGQVCNSKKVSDHYAIVPTMTAENTDLSALPAGEREILKMVYQRVLCAVDAPHVYEETIVTLSCGGEIFTVKGKTVISMGWKANLQQEQAYKALPQMLEGMTFPVENVSVKEGETTPPQRYTEDTLLSAMETAGAKEMPDDAERKGLGTPATRAAILEKLVSAGFVERRKQKKTTSLVPAVNGISLITVLPEQLQSPLLTAEWEQRLKQVEKGNLTSQDFMDAITEMVRELVQTYAPVKGAETLFPSGREIVGKCPRCGCNVTESKTGFFCESNDCRFGLWKDNKYLNAKKIPLTKRMVSSLLRERRTFVSGIYSEKTGKTYDAFLTLTDDGARTSFGIAFEC